MLSIFFQTLFFCLASPLFAQLPKASEFLPLQIGNIWQHQRADGFGVAVQSEVVSDTLLGDTLIVYELRFHAFQEEPPTEDWFEYRNYNHDSTAVFQHENFPENPVIGGIQLIDTQSGLQGTWKVLLGDTEGTAAITDTGSTLIFGETRKWAEVNLIDERSDTIKVVPGFHEVFMVGIGLTRVGFDTLLYARVDGVEFGTPVSVEATDEQSQNQPDEFSLTVYPNPAKSQSTVFLDNLPAQELEISIFNILGQKIRSFGLQSVFKGIHQIKWDGRDDHNRIVANGIYFVIARSSQKAKIHKFTFFR